MTDDPDLLCRVLERVVLEDRGFATPCWISTRGKLRGGYTGISIKGRMWQTHRYAYFLATGRIPTGMDIDHLCRQPACARPTHLELVTHHVNLLRGETLASVNARKQACPAGHAYSYISPGSGKRRCRPCDTQRTRERRQRLAQRVA